MNQILIIIPIILYLLLMLYIAYRVNKIKQNSDSFTEEYYIGNKKQTMIDRDILDKVKIWKR